MALVDSLLPETLSDGPPAPGSQTHRARPHPRDVPHRVPQQAGAKYGPVMAVMMGHYEGKYQTLLDAV